MDLDYEVDPPTNRSEIKWNEVIDRLISLFKLGRNNDLQEMEKN